MNYEDDTTLDPSDMDEFLDDDQFDSSDGDETLEQLVQRFTSKARRLVELRDAADEAEAAHKAAKSEFQNYQADLWDALSDLPMKPPFKFDLGAPYGVVTIHPKETYYARVLDADAVLEHFENRAMVEDVSAPKLVKSRLNDIVRDVVEGNGEKMPPGLDFTATRYITISKPKGS